MDLIETYQEKQEEESKREILLGYNTARLTAMFVLNGLNGKSSPSFNELFPGLLDQPKVDNNRLSAAEYQRAMMYKEQMIDFAIAHNKKRKAKEGE